MISVTGGVPAAVTSASHTADDLHQVAVIPIRGLDAALDRVPAGHVRATIASTQCPAVAPYLRFCAFRE